MSPPAKPWPNCALAATSTPRCSKTGSTPPGERCPASPGTVGSCHGAGGDASVGASPACSQARGFYQPSAGALPAPTTVPAPGADPQLQPQGRVRGTGPGHPPARDPSRFVGVWEGVAKAGSFLVSRKPSCGRSTPLGSAGSWCVSAGLASRFGWDVTGEM